MRSRVRSVPHSCRKTSRSKFSKSSLLYLSARSTISCKYSRQTIPYDYIVFAKLSSSPVYIYALVQKRQSFVSSDLHSIQRVSAVACGKQAAQFSYGPL